jgi:hypothetical protein
MSEYFANKLARRNDTELTVFPATYSNYRTELIYYITGATSGFGAGKCNSWRLSRIQFVTKISGADICVNINV